MPSPAAGAVPATPSGGTAAIRNVALIGPSGAGKTTLCELLLHEAGAIATAGSVERGTTTSDHDLMERRMQHSLACSVLRLEHDGVSVTLLDTPGGQDFAGHCLPALEAVETAVIVVNAAVGVEPMTHRFMALAAERHLDRLVVVNRIDMAPDRLANILEDIQSAFGRECLPLNLPDGGGTQVVDCFFQRDGHSDFGSVASAHRALVEQVVEVDPHFVDRYLNDGDVDPTELHEPLEQALREGHLVPVCFTSSRSGAGVKQLLEVIARLLPCPLEANPPEFLDDVGDGARPVDVRADPDRHVLAHVFKVMVDPYMGRVGLVRVHQGTIRPGMQLYVGHARKPFRVAHIYRLQGKEMTEVPLALPGDIVALAKAEAIVFDAVLHDAPEDEGVHLRPMAFPVPVHGMAVVSRRQSDEQRLWDALSRWVEEDPCLRLERDRDTHEAVIYGLGELHLRVLLERLREVHRLDVEARPPRIAYRETISAPAEGHHRHKKQTGGAGQFGEVFLRVEPLARGEGFVFVDEVKGGAIPGVFIPAVEKGVREVLASGAISGHPVVDVRVTLLDGKHHSVDSKEIAFVTAGRKAFLSALREARPVVLEPVVDVEIEAPATTVGDITGDLAGRRGQVGSTRVGVDGTMLICGQAPLAELQGYQNRLNALTAGQGRYTLALSHYAVAPAATQRALMSAWRGSEDE